MACSTSLTCLTSPRQLQRISHQVLVGAPLVFVLRPIRHVSLRLVRQRIAKRVLIAEIRRALDLVVPAMWFLHWLALHAFHLLEVLVRRTPFIMIRHRRTTILPSQLLLHGTDVVFPRFCVLILLVLLFRTVARPLLRPVTMHPLATCCFSRDASVLILTCSTLVLVLLALLSVP